MNDKRQLTAQDREKITRLLTSGSLDNQQLALSLVEETAGATDISKLFPVNVLVELACVNDPEEFELMIRTGYYLLDCPATWERFSKIVIDPRFLTLQKCSHLDLETYALTNVQALSARGAGWIVEHSGVDLDLDSLPDLPNAVAEILGKHQGNLSLNGITSLSDTAAEILGKHQGNLSLNGITKLSDAAAEALSKHLGKLFLLSLQDLSENAIDRLAQPAGIIETNAAIRARIRTQSSSKRKKNRESIQGDQTILTKSQRTKVRKLLRSKNADQASMAVQMIENSGATPHDILDIFSTSILSLLVNSWNIDLWAALTPLLQKQPLLSQEFSDLVRQRFMNRPKSKQRPFHDALCQQESLYPLIDGFSLFMLSDDEYKFLWLRDLPHLPDAAIEGLSQCNEDLRLDGLTRLSDAAAESLSQCKGDICLDGLTKLPDAAAESLSQCKGALSLNGLTSLSDAAAESLSQSQGDLSLSGLARLSDAAVESLRTYKGDLCLDELTNLSDAAAESLGQYTGNNLSLDGLTNLSDAAAESLRQYTGNNLSLNGLTRLSDAAAESLGQYTGSNLSLNGLISLSDAAAESFGQCRRKGLLQLEALTHLSDVAAESLSKSQRGLLLGLGSLSDMAAESLSQFKGFLQLNKLTSLTDAAAESLSKQPGTLRLRNVSQLSDAAVRILGEKSDYGDVLSSWKLSATAKKIYKNACRR